MHWLLSCSVVSNSLQLMDYTLPGSSVHGVLQAKTLEWICHALLQVIFPGTQGSNLYLLHWQANSLPLHHLGSPLPHHTIP